MAASGGLREAARLLRSAEALSRAAVAQLLVPPGASSDEAPVLKKKKKARKRGSATKQSKEGEGDVDMALVELGGSLVVGDLSELGLPPEQSMLIVAPTTTSASPSTRVATIATARSATPSPTHAMAASPASVGEAEAKAIV